MLSNILPLLLEILRFAPSAVEAGASIVEGVQKIWESVAAEDPPTWEQRAQYDAAEAEAFAALMKSTEDVAEDGGDAA